MSWIALGVGAVALLSGSWLRAAASAISQVPRADAHHDAAEGVRGARTVASLLDERAAIQPAAGMVGTALLVVAAVLGVAGAGSVWPAIDGPALAAIVVLTVVGMGDIIPRILGRRWADRVAYRSAPIISAAVALGGWAVDGSLDEALNGEEDEDEDEDELALISSVLTFSETIVREVMVPRPDMVSVSAALGRDDLAAAAIEHGFSRFPVVDGDDVIGLLLVKDLLATYAGNEGSETTARALMRDPVFVPEVKQIADLLADMRASKTHMAIVVDEFGEIAGLVTIEDLLEELVGEIADETDDDETWVEPIGDGVWKVDARLAVEELSELVSAELPNGDWDTVGGLVLGLAERVPEEDECFEVETVSLSVARMQGRRVAEVIVSDSRRSFVGEDG